YVSHTHAFLWKNGSRHDLGTLPGYANSSAAGISDHGEIVGFCAPNGHKDRNHLVLWQNGKIRDTGLINPALTPTAAINDDGQIVMAATIRDGNGRLHSLGTLQAGVPSDAFFINSASPSSVVGNSYGHGFLWRDGKMTMLGTLGGWTSQAKCVNNRDQVVDWAELRHRGRYHAFLWQHGKMTDLGALRADGGGIANAINDQGVIVGEDDTGHAVLWKNGKIVDLNDELPTHAHVILSDAVGINNHGEILCNGSITGEMVNSLQEAYLLVPR
ncbi:MAG: hypothetical protein M3Y13_14935, partial [Armatimonadota bacterium]|nr:hypothetical protein [Armatimonadota bacterium]